MASLSLHDVLQREHDALSAETRLSNAPPFVALNNIEDVTRYPSSLRWSYAATVRGLDESKGRAWVVECPSLGAINLWVRTDNDSYRPDYLAFLNSVHKLGLEQIPDPYDVDHLYNRERAKVYGLQFLRMALVGHRVNRSHGSSIEKDLTVNEAMRSRRDHKSMDEIASMKYFGFLPPLRSDPREEEIKAYCLFAQTRLGLDPVEVRKSILYLREKASKPWAKK